MVAGIQCGYGQRNLLFFCGVIGKFTNSVSRSVFYHVFRVMISKLSVIHTGQMMIQEEHTNIYMRPTTNNTIFIFVLNIVSERRL